MKILSFDTSNNLASVALIINDIVVSYNITEEISQQAEKLFELIHKTLSAHNLNLADLDLVSVTNGPGSFTGVRIGLAAALGMRMACKAHFISLTNFQVLAWHAAYSPQSNFNHQQNLVILLDARRDQFYIQSFDQSLSPIDIPKLIEKNDLQKFLSQDMSSLIIANDQEMSPLFQTVNAKLVAEASKFFWQEKLYHDLIPLYIREADINRNCKNEG